MSGVAEVSSTYLAKMASNSFPVGYKQTEVGVIPEDWEIFSLSSLSAKITDGTHDTPRPVREGRPFLTAIHVKDGHIDFDGCYFVSETVHQEIYRRCNPEFGDILMVNIGAGTATTAVVNVTYEFSLKNVALIKPNKFNNGTYVNYALSFAREKTLETVVGGGAQPFLSLNQIANLKIAAPHLKEQTAIANALSDVDALISELEKLIAKKQAIKTATMQQLLTGRTRLPQFALREDGTPKGTKPSELGEIPVDWEVVCFSQCGYFQSGSGFPTKYQGKQEGDYPFFKVSDMNNVGNENNLINSNNYISETVRNLISAKLIPVNAIVFAKIGAAIFLERKKICFQTSCIDNNMMAYIVNDKKLYYKYAYLLFKNINLAQFVEATALPSLSGRDIGQKIVALPTSEEQTAIATILSDMDAEIQALEQRLGKTRQIKQGMMQELLTGKTRLPYDEE